MQIARFQISRVCVEHSWTGEAQCTVDSQAGVAATWMHSVHPQIKNGHNLSLKSEKNVDATSGEG